MRVQKKFLSRVLGFPALYGTIDLANACKHGTARLYESSN
jgi:hypothetical protein